MKMLAKFRKNGAFKVISKKAQSRLKGGTGGSSGHGSVPPPPPPPPPPDMGG